MTIYSSHVSNVDRTTGSNAAASCSCITLRRTHNGRTGEAFSGLGRRERVGCVCTMLPEDVLGEYLDPERSFNVVEMVEKRPDARPAEKIMAALPREFDACGRFRTLEDFISWNIMANGYTCTYAIHTGKDGRNLHAYILVANRYINPKTGRWAAENRNEFALDASDRCIPVIGPDTGRQKIGVRNCKVWKRVSASNNPLDPKEFPERLRHE